MVPYRPLLSNPTLSMLTEQVKGELLSQSDDLDRPIDHVAIGAMQPRHLIERVGPGSLLIVPGDRTDVIHAVVAANRAARQRSERRGIFGRRHQAFGRAAQDETRTEMAGMVLTGGYRPRPRDLEAIRNERMFAMLVDEDTYEAASKVHDLLVKTHPADREKIAMTEQLISDHIDIDALLARFGEPSHAARPHTIHAARPSQQSGISVHASEVWRTEPEEGAACHLTAMAVVACAGSPATPRPAQSPQEHSARHAIAGSNPDIEAVSGSERHRPSRPPSGFRTPDPTGAPEWLKLSGMAAVWSPNGMHFVSARTAVASSTRRTAPLAFMST